MLLVYVISQYSGESKYFGNVRQDSEAPEAFVKV